jgi:hypothetical protein
MILGLCVGVVVWLLFMLGHFTAMRLVAPADRAKIDRALLLLGFLAIPAGIFFGLQTVTYPILAQGGWLMGLLWGLLAYLCLFSLYMPFFYTVATSLSVHTIVLLAQEPDGSLPISVLFEHFASHSLIQKRLAVMVQNGLMFSDGTGYRLTSKGRFVAEAFSILKRFWRLWPGG